jgi:hypothetical protein
LLGIVDIARAVLQPEDVAGLRDVGQERVVAGIFPMMRVEAAEGPVDGGPGPDHRAVHVDRDPGQVQAGEGLGHEITVERHEGARVSCVNCRSQFATVRRVGSRARPQKRMTSGSPLRKCRCSSRRAPA